MLDMLHRWLTVRSSRSPAARASTGLLRLLVVVATSSALPATAMTTTYQCTGYRILTAEFTPRAAQLHFEGQDYTMRRVGDSHEATFVDGRHGVTVVMRQGELSLHLPKEQLACTLRSDALRDLAPASRPAAGASSAR